MDPKCKNCIQNALCRLKSVGHILHILDNITFYFTPYGNMKQITGRCFLVWLAGAHAELPVGTARDKH